MVGNDNVSSIRWEFWGKDGRRAHPNVGTRPFEVGVSAGDGDFVRSPCSHKEQNKRGENVCGYIAKERSAGSNEDGAGDVQYEPGIDSRTLLQVLLSEESETREKQGAGERTQKGGQSCEALVPCGKGVEGSVRAGDGGEGIEGSGDELGGYSQVNRNARVVGEKMDKEELEFINKYLMNVAKRRLGGSSYSDREDMISETIEKIILSAKDEKFFNMSWWAREMIWGRSRYYQKVAKHEVQEPEDISDFLKYSHSSDQLDFVAANEAFQIVLALPHNEKLVCLMIADGASIDEISDETGVSVLTILKIIRSARSWASGSIDVLQGVGGRIGGAKNG